MRRFIILRKNKRIKIMLEVSIVLFYENGKMSWKKQKKIIFPTFFYKKRREMHEFDLDMMVVKVAKLYVLFICDNFAQFADHMISIWKCKDRIQNVKNKNEINEDTMQWKRDVCMYVWWRCMLLLHWFPRCIWSSAQWTHTYLHTQSDEPMKASVCIKAYCVKLHFLTLLFVILSPFFSSSSQDIVIFC